jgi:hypothetical protein
MLFLYLASVVISIVSWLDAIIGYTYYYQRLVEMGGPPIEHLPGVGFVPILMAITFLAGTLGAVVYFVRTDSHSDS